MKKLSIHLIFFSLLIVALAFSCSTEVEDTTSTPIVQIPDPETEPESLNRSQLNILFLFPVLKGVLCHQKEELMMKEQK